MKSCKTISYLLCLCLCRRVKFHDSPYEFILLQLLLDIMLSNRGCNRVELLLDVANTPSNQIVVMNQFIFGGIQLLPDKWEVCIDFILECHT